LLILIARPAALGGAASAASADLRHVLAVDRNLLAPLSPGGSRFIRREFVSLPFLVGRPPSFAGDLALPMFIHRRETSVFGSRLCIHAHNDSLQTHFPLVSFLFLVPPTAKDIPQKRRGYSHDRNGHDKNRAEVTHPTAAKSRAAMVIPSSAGPTRELAMS
jgi:hypothetical protein